MKTRKQTRFELCGRHRPWFEGNTRARQIECMVEGGPGGWAPGCVDGKCRIWPGTDVFYPEVCGGELELEWTHATVRFAINGDDVLARIDPTPWPIRDFERSRDYVRTDDDGVEYVLVTNVHAGGADYVAHPTA